jgi:hypothetical protein
VTSAEREAEIFRLKCLDLDLYLEQRAAYRELVSRCAHKGVRPPEKPKFRADVRERASAPARDRRSVPGPARHGGRKSEAQSAGPAMSRRIIRPNTGAILDVY